MINVALLGHGVVGSGVAEIMTKSKESLSKKIKQDIELKYILDLRSFDNLPYSNKFIKDFNIILNDDSVKIVVEVIGGLHPSFDFVKACLEKGKSVVSHFPASFLSSDEISSLSKLETRVTYRIAE